jgi:hypothetical protein
MPLVPNFTVTQSLGSPNLLEFNDTSTGSDGAVVNRWIYIQQANGTYIVEGSNTTTDYTEVPYIIDPVTLDVLTKDVAVQITVEWLDSSDTVLYTKSNVFKFTNFNENFDYALTQNLTANPLLINDNDFFANKSELRTCIDSGNQAFDLVGDLFSAQQCYDRATNLRINSQYFFNINS